MVLGIIEFLWEEWVKNGVFWTFFRVFMFFWPNQAGYGKNDMRFGISIKN